MFLDKCLKTRGLGDVAKRRVPKTTVNIKQTVQQKYRPVQFILLTYHIVQGSFLTFMNLKNFKPKKMTIFDFC